MGYAFISYSSKDQQMADSVRELFNRNGIETWMAPGDIPFGETYMSTINRAIRESACFAILLSENSQGSNWVRKETERAVSRGKTIFTIMLDDVPMNDAFEFMLSESQAVAVRKINDEDADIQKLLKGVKAYTGEAVKEEIHVPQSDHSVTEPIPKQVGFSGDVDELRAISAKFPNYDDIIPDNAGAFSHVYRAYDPESDKSIAIKTYPTSDTFHMPIFFNSELFWLFEKEISHPNLCRIIDRSFETPTCLVMEYVTGKELSFFINIKYYSVYDSVRVRSVLLGILKGLKALHDKNVYYGDLSPRNIIVDDDKVFLCDFSQSNFNNTDYIDKTAIIEKYRSPEKRAGCKLDYRSDIYEFGMILSDFLFWFEDSEREKIYSIINKCTEKEPANRYQSVNEIIEALTETFERELDDNNYQISDNGPILLQERSGFDGNVDFRSTGIVRQSARLSKGIIDIEITKDNPQSFSNPVELLLPDNNKLTFELYGTTCLNGGTYQTLSRSADFGMTIIYIYKNSFVFEGRQRKVIYRAFMEKHKDEFVFADAEEFRPNIQPVKGKQPRGFIDKTAMGMFGPNLPSVIEIPAKYSFIGAHVFRPPYDKGHLREREISKLVIPNSVKTIDEFAFADIVVNTVVVPDSVTSIGPFAFNLTADGYIECSKESYAYRYSLENHLRNSVDIAVQNISKGLCRYCGGTFKGLVKKKCNNCGKEKDY